LSIGSDPARLQPALNLGASAARLQQFSPGVSRRGLGNLASVEFLWCGPVLPC